MNDIEKIKQKINIVDLIGEYLPLKKSGRNFKAVCPFHSEKTPSFLVSEERQIWHCFGCQKGGDIFTFLMEFEKIDFSQSLRFLAEKAGVKLESRIIQSDREKKKETIYALNHLAQTFYSFLLLEHSVGKNALSYLTEKRQIPQELVKKFDIGFAPNQTNVLSNYLIKKKGYEAKDLIDAGLASNQGRGIYDFFRNRIILPIFDTRGNVIAFSGRALSDQPPKYINTKETLVYKKGDTLFGLNQAKDEIKKENVAILVEGEFDVLSSFKEGVKNVVAVKGTALTENQLRTLKRFAQKINLCFDTDQAGVEAQRRSIELIEKEGILANVIIPPHGKDVDELIKEDPILFKKTIKNEVNIFDFIIDSALLEFDKNTPEGKRQILDKTLSILILIENEVVKEHFFKKLANSLNTSLESVLRQAEKIKKPHFPETKVALFDQDESKIAKSREETIEPYLLSLIFQAKDPKKAFLKSQEILENIDFSTLNCQRLYKIFADFINNNHDNSVFSINDFALNLPAELLESFDKFYLYPIPQFETEEKYYFEIQKVSKWIKQAVIKAKLKKLSDLIKEKEKENQQEEAEKLKNEFGLLLALLNETEPLQNE